MAIGKNLNWEKKNKTTTTTREVSIKTWLPPAPLSFFKARQLSTQLQNCVFAAIYMTL